MANDTQQDNTFSGFVEEEELSESSLSHDFTDMEVVAVRQYNILVKAQRNGKWWMLKALRPEYRNTVVCQEALRKEYDVLSQLQHPGVVAVEGYEDVDGYGKCIIMEYVNGKNLHETLQQGLPLSVRQNIARELIDALRYIHRKQVVHRDIKPSNIMVMESTGYIKLIDFGCSDGDSYTFLKQPAGTESYISPEQQSSAEADLRNDIYSLGRVLQDLKLGKKCEPLIQRCLLPIDQRYQSIEELQKDFDLTIFDHHKSWGWIIIPAIVLISLVFAGIRYHWSEYVYSWAKEIHLTNYDFVEDGIYYNILSKDSCAVEVTWNGATNSYSGDITVPEFVEHGSIKYHVVRIGDNSFSHCDSLIAVVLPKSIHSIGSNAFLWDRQLATINLPDSITEMGDSVLRDCDHLRSVRFPQSMKEIPPYCFSGCSKLREMNIHEGITALRRDALAGTGFDAITMPHSMRTIDRGSMWACLNLKKVTIPENVEDIGDFVFWHCDSLRDVYVEHQKPLSVTNIFQDLKNVRLHVPKGASAKYKKATGWNDLQIVE